MKPNLETRIKLRKFKPREYQIPILDAFQKGYRMVLAIWPRRGGKDITAFNHCVMECIRKPIIVYYIFPTYAQGKKVLWDGLTISGLRIIEDYVPPELVETINSQEMKIRFKNGSLLQVCGSDNIDSLVGTNPSGIVFSEYALQSPSAYQFLRPVLAANDGWCLFLSTPRGRNHLWELYNIAVQNPNKWYVDKLTLEDTKHIPLSEIEHDRAMGLMSEDLIQQEYYTSFDRGIEGSYYGKYLDKLRVNNQIGIVPWEPDIRVNSAWDIGVHDFTSIIFFQVVGPTIRIIDVYENSNLGLDHYAKIVQSKPYTYNKHFGPHDLRVREWGGGAITRYDKAKQLGINFHIAPDVPLDDGIEAVWSNFNKFWIDEHKCDKLLKAMENYRREWDDQKMRHKDHPLHNWACFVGETLILTRSGMRQIMDINKNDEILTKFGWRKCNKAKITGRNADLVEVTFQDGTKVKCTPEHKFLTDIGWKSAKNLAKDSVIQSSLTQLHNTSMDISIGFGLTRDISLKEALFYIEMFGPMLLAQSQMAAIYTTKILILKIIVCQISYVYLLVNTGKFQDHTIKDLAITVEELLQNGIDQKQEFYGTSAMQSDQKIGKSGNESQEIVNSAIRNSLVSLEKMDTNKNFAILTAKPLLIESVKPLEEKADVYCINVPKVHHFSLSNGAIVHNSNFADALRYLCVSLPKVRDGLTAQELDRRYTEAVYGKESNLPPIFRTQNQRY